MASIYKNQRGHLIIQLNVHEATDLNIGIEIPGLNNLCLCDTCNNECKPEDIYYIAGINEIMCKDCVEDYVDNMNHFNDDNSIQYEINHFNAVAKKLNMKERAVLTSEGKLIICGVDDIKELQPCYY